MTNVNSQRDEVPVLDGRPAPLDYRNPLRGGDIVAWLANELAKDEALGAATASGKLALGFAMCLIGPIFVTAVAMDIESRWDWRSAPGFGVTLLVFAVILMMAVTKAYLEHIVSGIPFFPRRRRRRPFSRHA